jgi:hypothetical protein
MNDPVTIDQPLRLKDAFRFPLQSARARREVLIGAMMLVLLPGIGWLMNMGHRIRMVHRMQHGEPAWPAWEDWFDVDLLVHGSVTFLGMLYYYTPGLGLIALGWSLDSTVLLIAGGAALVLATIAIPGFMSHYCVNFDLSEIFNPARALGRVVEGGSAYWHAWFIAAAALALSFLGLLLLGVGFLVTSVWFWQVAGFSFACVFSQRFELVDADSGRP